MKMSYTEATRILADARCVGWKCDPECSLEWALASARKFLEREYLRLQ